MKENPQMIKKYLKTSNSYIERRRRQIKQEKERLNKSSDYKNNYGFSLKDFVSEENNNYLYGDRVINTTSPYIRTKKGNEKGELILDLKRNNINAFIPPYSQRIFCYYDENGDFNNSVKYNNFSNVDISQISFIDAINEYGKNRGKFQKGSNINPVYADKLEAEQKEENTKQQVDPNKKNLQKAVKETERANKLAQKESEKADKEASKPIEPPKEDEEQPV